MVFIGVYMLLPLDLIIWKNIYIYLMCKIKIEDTQPKSGWSHVGSGKSSSRTFALWPMAIWTNFCMASTYVLATSLKGKKARRRWLWEWVSLSSMRTWSQGRRRQGISGCSWRMGRRHIHLDSTAVQLRVSERRLGDWVHRFFVSFFITFCMQ